MTITQLVRDAIIQLVRDAKISFTREKVTIEGIAALLAAVVLALVVLLA